MNTQDIINYIIAHLPDHYVGEKRNPQNWVKSTSREVSSQGAIYLMECFQCMENFGLAPAGLIATVYLNQAHDEILRCQITDLDAQVEQYSRMVEMFYGPLDDLRK